MHKKGLKFAHVAMKGQRDHLRRRQIFTILTPTPSRQQFFTTIQANSPLEHADLLNGWSQRSCQIRNKDRKLKTLKVYLH